MIVTQQIAAYTLDKIILPEIEVLTKKLVNENKYFTEIVGDLVTPQVVNGLFIASDIDWKTINDCMKYNLEHSNMLLDEEDKLFDIIKDLKIEEQVNQEKYAFTIEEYCRSEINLAVSSQLKLECISYIPHLLEKWKVTSDIKEANVRADPIIKWLNDEKRKEEIFYYVTEFEIKTSIDPTKYVEKALNQLNVKKSKLRRSRTKDDKAEEFLDIILDELNRNALRVTEIITEKIIYTHLKNAFLKENTSPFIAFIRRKLDLSIITPEPQELGKNIDLSAKITTNTKNKFTLSDDFNIEVDSDYFKLSKISHEGDGSCSKDKPLEATITIEQKIQNIIENDITSYPIKIKIISYPEEILLDEKIIHVKLDEPKFNISVDGTRLPYKGEQITLNIKILKSQVTKPIDIKIKCRTEDFQIDGSSDKEKSVIIKVEPKKEINNKTLYLVANRSGLWGYENTLNLSFSIGKWERPFKKEQIRMIVLPSFMDMTIAGLTTITGVISHYYPNIIPSITSDVNIASLSPIGALLYLSYRAFMWTSNTGKKTGG
ncbi:MAG: hypothetical protein ACXACY_23800 [Candidatus Hodarchaeales archaeon]|jgi:hypothetical protein